MLYFIIQKVDSNFGENRKIVFVVIVIFVVKHFLKFVSDFVVQ